MIRIIAFISNFHTRKKSINKKDSILLTVNDCTDNNERRRMENKFLVWPRATVTEYSVSVMLTRKEFTKRES